MVQICHHVMRWILLQVPYNPALNLFIIYTFFLNLIKKYIFGLSNQRMVIKKG